MTSCIHCLGGKKIACYQNNDISVWSNRPRVIDGIDKEHTTFVCYYSLFYDDKQWCPWLLPLREMVLKWYNHFQKVNAAVELSLRILVVETQRKMCC